MQISLCDYYDSLWVTAYDAVAEKIVGMAALEFAKLNED
jgi:hypothetical protein